MRNTQHIARGWLVLCVACGLGARAHAFDPATTHAGLTQQAVVASALHQIMALRLSRPLGIFEPVALHPERLDADQRRLLLARLEALDPAGGYRPGTDGVASALAFVVAGSVIAKTPSERIQHMFFDPSTGTGLRDDEALDGFVHALRLLADAGGSVRQLATGTGFSMEGEPSLKWLEAPHNEVGRPAFDEHIERAIAEADPAARSAALARALLALGGILAVLEDAGNPAQVRNDFRASYLKGRTGGAFDRTSRFERTVSERYGIGGVPAPQTTVRRPNLRAFFTDADGQGLADRTQRRFFSDGTVPEDGVVEHDTTAADVVREARKSLTYALPTFSHLNLRDSGIRRYVIVNDGDTVGLGGAGVVAPAPSVPRKLLAYERVPGRVRFFLDARVDEDTARILLPEIAAYAAGLIDHLLRGEVRLVREGSAVRATVVGPAGSIRGGKLRLFVDDGTGQRRELTGAAVGPGAVEGFTVTVPAEARRVAAVLRGWDDAGPVVAFGELALPARR